MAEATHPDRQEESDAMSRLMALLSFLLQIHPST